MTTGFVGERKSEREREWAGERGRERTIDHTNTVFHTVPSQPPPPSPHPSSLPHPISTLICPLLSSSSPPPPAYLHINSRRQPSSDFATSRRVPPFELHSQSLFPHAPFCAREKVVLLQRNNAHTIVQQLLLLRLRRFVLGERDQSFCVQPSSATYCRHKSPAISFLPLIFLKRVYPSS